jgi:DNA-binding CsgD family transcriptional regulator
MAIQRHSNNPKRILSALGISDTEEQIYTLLLTCPGMTAREVADTLGLGLRKLQRLLDAISSKGLVTRSLDRPRRYLPASPDIVVESLISERQAELQRTRGAVAKLQGMMATSEVTYRHSEMVELISGREAARHIFEQLDRIAQQEILALMRPPLLVTRVDDDNPHASQRQAQARGVCFRSVASRDFMAVPGVLTLMLEDMRSGEEIRVTESLPLKMVMFDRRVALIPLDPHGPDSPTLLVRSSALLEALYVMFEMLWDTATPISSSDGSYLKNRGASPHRTAREDQFIALLASGLNDKMIADELGISQRTLGRHVLELEKHFGARTRFQLGWIAAKRLSAAQVATKRARARSATQSKA